jgi:hypothetical protein
MLDVRRLKVLREVAARGSFSAAADALAFTQPAVSRQIATLEAEAGMPLVERGARGIRLTAAGELLVSHAEVILDRLAAAEHELEALAGLSGGRLRVGAFPSANATLIPLALAAFDEQYPDVAPAPAQQPHGRQQFASSLEREIPLGTIADEQQLDATTRQPTRSDTGLPDGRRHDDHLGRGGGAAPNGVHEHAGGRRGPRQDGPTSGRSEQQADDRARERVVPPVEVRADERRAVLDVHDPRP